MNKLLVTGIVLGGAAFMAADRTTPTEVAPAATPAPVRAPASALDELSVSNFARRRSDVEIGDLFSVPAPPPAPAPPPTLVTPPKPEPVAAPAVPPLPFTYLGRMTRRGNPVVYLLRNEEMVLAHAGDTIDGTYLVENISSSAVQFVYLPLQARQHLTIPHAL